MSLPWRAKLIIVAACTGGAVVLGVAIRHLYALGHLDADRWCVLVLVSALLLGSWVRPLVLYRGAESEAFHVDEAFFVILALLVPPAATVLVFVGATLLAQVVKRRALVKSAFNLGQVAVSVGVGLFVSQTLAAPTSALTAGQVAAVAAGAVAYFVVNSTSVAAVLVAVGNTWRECLVDGLTVRLALVGAGAAVGLISAVAISAYPWVLPLAALVLVGLRYVLVGHFESQHDRTRLQGLFEATLEINRRLRSDGALDALLESSRLLLRCADARLSDDLASPGQLATRLTVDGADRWLVVSGRRRDEPFDPADQALLDALGAVGSAALTNATLYDQVRFEQERLSSITDSIGEGVCALDDAGRLTFVNPAAADMLGLPQVSAAPDGQGGPGDVAPVPAPDFLVAPARAAMLMGGGIRNEDASFRGRNGVDLPVAYTVSAVLDGERPAGAVIAFRDITERKAYEEEMTHQAFFDTLTGLGNRRLLLDQLERAISRVERNGTTLALVFVDVDRFKSINDSLGHSTGDELLVMIAERMRSVTRPGDVLARFGGDEFILLLENVGTEGDAVGAARRISAAVKEPVLLSEGYEVVPTVSIGIALSAPGKTGDDMLRDADVAMYEAKARGRSGSYQVFDTAVMGSRSAGRLDMEGALRKGIERGELEVYYQPFYAIADRRVVGAEALVRWHHPTRGLLGPGWFIGLAEETGLILPLGRFVLEEACRQAQLVRTSLGIDLAMNVNLSPRQLQQPRLASELGRALQSSGLEPDQLVLEITETMVMEDIANTRDVLRTLQNLGVKLAIDDFGTGHSSLGYLKKFPVSEIKVDRGFVAGLGVDPVDSAIVKAVIDLASALQVTAVAEGVETEAQLRSLRALGCPLAEGFYFSRPLPAADFVELLDPSERVTSRARVVDLEALLRPA